MALPNSKPRCVSSMPSLTQRRTLACVRSTSLQRTELLASARSRMRHSRPSANFGGGSPANTRASTCSTGRSNFRGSTSSLPSAARSSSRKRSARDSDAVPTASTFSFTRYSAVGAVGLEQRLRQQLVARLLLELALGAPAGLLLHALAIFREAYLERLVDGRHRQHAHLVADANEIRAGDAARERTQVGACRRLEARAALGVAAARLEHRGCEPLGQSLLGVGPWARHGIETDAAEHRRLLRNR